MTVGTLEDGDGFYVADDGPGFPTTWPCSSRGRRRTPTGPGSGSRSSRRSWTRTGGGVAATESVDGGARFEVPGVEFVEDGGADGDADATDDSDDAPASDGDASA